MGPVVKESSAKFILSQIENAVNNGAKKVIDESKFSNELDFSNYLIPQVLVEVNHDMNFMMEETFGPAIGIMKVRSDEEAIN